MDNCNPLPFNDLQLHSNAIKKVIDALYTLMVSSNVFANQNVRGFTVLPFAARRLSRCHRRSENPGAITPLFATHTSCSQLAENTTALSSLLATHTDFTPVSPVFATHTKTPGVYTNNSHSGTEERRRAGWSLLHQPQVTNHQSPTVVSFHTVNILLNEIECRVLGSLVEKEITTPEYYPLSLNALVNACNQKSNREPAMNLDEAAVRKALHSLDEQSLIRSVSATDSRVTKYEHRLQEAYNFYRHEIAILCVLLLRGPQTPGELRTRAERMHPFDDLSAVQSSLQHLMKREPPLAKVLARQPGTKEARYAHLLSGVVEVLEAKSQAEATPNALAADGERIANLEQRVATLQKEIAELKQQFALFRKQFE
jgi:uncharacterized protein YceH (UPF0502 family)